MSKDTLLTENLKNMEGFNPDVDVVKDLPYKDEYINNSFFAIGHLVSEGHTLDYLYHLMSYAYPGKEPEMTYCFSITDETDKKYYQFSHAYPFSEITVATDEYEIKTPAGDLDDMHLTANMNHGAIDLHLKSIGYPIYNGGTSKFHMVGMDIYEYSIPTMLTNGTLTLDGHVYEIKDQISWYDKQWQQKMPKMPEFAAKGMQKMMSQKMEKFGGFKLPVWGWMDLNLENGDKVSTWFAEEGNGENCWATVMHPDGSQRTVRVESVVATASDHWISPHAKKAQYPMTYKVVIPELEADLTVKTVVDDQELIFPENDLYNHYEGASTVEGTYQGEKMNGYCYVELIGDWSKK